MADFVCWWVHGFLRRFCGFTDDGHYHQISSLRDWILFYFFNFRNQAVLLSHFLAIMAASNLTFWRLIFFCGSTHDRHVYQISWCQSEITFRGSVSPTEGMNCNLSRNLTSHIPHDDIHYRQLFDLTFSPPKKQSRKVCHWYFLTDVVCACSNEGNPLLQIEVEPTSDVSQFFFECLFLYWVHVVFVWWLQKAGIISALG